VSRCRRALVMGQLSAKNSRLSTRKMCRESTGKTVGVYVSKDTRRLSLNIFARRTRQLKEAKQCYEQLSNLRTETVQIVTGEDKDLHKYAHHLNIRSFQSCLA
jgi:hypothetical protein